MNYDHEIALAELKKRYPAGCVVELVSMDDRCAPPEGTKGEVIYVDDIGTVHVQWETGSTLGVVFSVDEICLVSKAPGTG